METPPLLSTIITILFLCLPCLQGENSQICLSAVCRKDEPVIRFPFRIQTLQLEWCGYSGFDVFCDRMNRSVIELPNVGNLTVERIDYAGQQVWLNDPESCLPRKILSLDFSLSPFSGVYYQDFSFFNCSPDNINYGINPIACLSSSKFTVFATSSPGVYNSLSSSCRHVKTVSVPVQLPFFDQVPSSDLAEDLRLKWDSPRCSRCESRGGMCSLKANSTNEIKCTDIYRHGIPRVARYTVTVGVGIPALLCLVGLACFGCNRVKSSLSRCPYLPSVSQLAPSTPPPNSHIISGLNGATIETFPKIVLGESRRLPKPNDITCPICLSEYQPKDTLRTIPECNHCFHAACVDEWLRLNASCPVCRKCPTTQQPLRVGRVSRQALSSLNFQL